MAKAVFASMSTVILLTLAGAGVGTALASDRELRAIPDRTGRTMTVTAINGQVPGQIVRLPEGDTVTLSVTNGLPFTSSIHWHGLRVPSSMDGVPGFSFNGIAPGQTFVYRFLLCQSGTYWHHAHGPEEQTGVHGTIVVEPKGGFAQPFHRDYVVMLSDWRR
jgi:FtsP/CotA-like multicopper oxidase with cupredoxin domain